MTKKNHCKSQCILCYVVRTLWQIVEPSENVVFHFPGWIGIKYTMWGACGSAGVTGLMWGQPCSPNEPSVIQVWLSSLWPWDVLAGTEQLGPASLLLSPCSFPLSAGWMSRAASGDYPELGYLANLVWGRNLRCSQECSWCLWSPDNRVFLAFCISSRTALQLPLFCAVFWGSQWWLSWGTKDNLLGILRRLERRSQSRGLAGSVCKRGWRAQEWPGFCRS